MLITRAYAFVTRINITSTKCGKRSRKAEWFGELAFAIIDTLPALPDSVPDSSDFSPDSEDEVRAGIERKRIW